MRKTKTKAEIGKRERNEENKNRKEIERCGNGKPTFQRRTEMQAETKKRESGREKKRESGGDFQCNLSILPM